MSHAFKLVEIARDTSRAHYVTEDRLYEVLGWDLNCRGAAARAAGCGPVWLWRPAQPAVGQGFGQNEHPFGTKKACLASLDEEYARRHEAQHAPPKGSAIVACPCGKSNRISLDGLFLTTRDNQRAYSKRFRCGGCKREFSEPEIGGSIMQAIGLA